MRGVHSPSSSRTRGTRGSSPHARGPPSPKALHMAVTGFIPACAGSTFAKSLTHGSDGVHPRMRGVHQGEVFLLVDDQGSSPHARGPQGYADLPHLPARFIPACAGSTQGRDKSADCHKVHPRMRGVHSDNVEGRGNAWGSSPHARGPHEFWSGLIAGLRFIPACAGSTGPLWDL